MLTLITGTTIAQAIPLAVSPILTRIYSPEDFGVLALFISVTTILGAIINGRYEFAIILPEKDEDARALLGLCLLISSVISLFLLIIILSFHSSIIKVINNPAISMWLYFIPFVVFLIGTFNAFNYYFSRGKRFKNIAQANVTRSIALAGGQILFPLLKEGGGLVLGRILSTLVSPLFLWLKFTNNDIIIFNHKKITRVASRFINFPKYELWAGLFNNLSLNFNNIAIPIVYSTSVLGVFAIVYRVLAMPFTLIGASVGQVFFKEVSDVKNTAGEATKLVWEIVKKMGLISLLGFGLIFFIAEDLFAFVFGEAWRMSGLYAKYLLPLFMIKFIVSPLIVIHNVYEELKSSFLLQLLMILLSIAIILIAYILDLNFDNFIILFSSVMSLFYLIRFIIILKIAK